MIRWLPAYSSISILPKCPVERTLSLGQTGRRGSESQRGCYPPPVSQQSGRSPFSHASPGLLGELDSPCLEAALLALSEAPALRCPQPQCAWLSWDWGALGLPLPLPPRPPCLSPGPAPAGTRPAGTIKHPEGNGGQREDAVKGALRRCSLLRDHVAEALPRSSNNPG